jgi:hypothetical protein
MPSTPRSENLHIGVPTQLRRVKSHLPAIAKAPARRMTRGIGLLTAGQRSGPDFLILGTKRGGTTSLWNAMIGHPDVLPLFPSLQEIKSPRYFDLNYHRGSRWYLSHFPTHRERARHLRRTGQHAIAGEADPYYMFHPLAPARINADFPDVRVIISLRNPVDRAWSHYRERVGGGSEKLSFREALEAESARLEGESLRIRQGAPAYVSFHHNHSSYLARGRYEEHLPAIIDTFGSRLLILRAEDFYEQPRVEMRKVAQFLGLADFPVNSSIARYNQMPGRSMDAADRSFLVEHFRPHVAALEAQLGLGMRWSDFTSGPKPQLIQ